jgi:hypothetical protein
MQFVNINSMWFFGINLIRLYGHLIFMCTIDINQIVQSLLVILMPNNVFLWFPLVFMDG